MINVSVVQFCKYTLVKCDSATGYGMQNMIYASLSLLTGWWIHEKVCRLGTTTV